VTMQVSCYNNVGTSGASTTCSNAGVKAAISSGIANSSERAFYIGIGGASTTYP
jgi:hypothetical protein